jgi:hypothetical protein
VIVHLHSYIVEVQLYSNKVDVQYCHFRFYFSQWGKNLATVCQPWGQELLTLCLCGLLYKLNLPDLNYSYCTVLIHSASGFQVFSCLIFPQVPENNIRVISNFFENSRRYFQVKVHHRYQRHHWKILPQVPPVLVDTSGKFAAGVNNTSGKLPSVSKTPAVNLPQV